MRLRCPHCDAASTYRQTNVYGDWVVCPDCELPYAWRIAEDVTDDDERSPDEADESNVGAEGSRLTG